MARRAAQMADPGTRAAASQQIAMEEANELARLAVEHAAEKRRLRQSVLASLGGKHRSARRSLQQRQRHQRAGVAVLLRALRPPLANRARFRAVLGRPAWRAPAGN